VGDSPLAWLEEARALQREAEGQTRQVSSEQDSKETDRLAGCCLCAQDISPPSQKVRKSIECTDEMLRDQLSSFRIPVSRMPCHLRK